MSSDSVNNNPIKIDLGDSATANAVAGHGFIESNVGAADFDVKADHERLWHESMSGLSVTSLPVQRRLWAQSIMLSILWNHRGDLGALQNRLEYTINNLSSISNATAGARGRILDADFAKEASELTKHQILTQAATSMLAQASRSKVSSLSCRANLISTEAKTQIKAPMKIGAFLLSFSEMTKAQFSSHSFLIASQAAKTLSVSFTPNLEV